MLNVKLAALDKANRARQRAMERYRRQLPDWVRPVATLPETESVFHLAVVRVDDRERVVDVLQRNGIGWGIHYPIPCHRQPAYADFAVSLPVTEQAAGEILSIPMSPTITDAQVDRVCQVFWDMRRMGR